MFKIARVILFFIIFGSVAAYAEVAAPLGIEIGKSTLDDVRAKYRITVTEKGDGEGLGYYYGINTADLPLKNITMAFVNCNERGIVRAVTLKTKRGNFESFFKSLSSKYKLVFEHANPAGDKIADFNADNCLIRLTSAHNDLEMTISYLTKAFDDLVGADIEKKKRAQYNAL